MPAPMPSISACPPRRPRLGGVWPLTPLAKRHKISLPRALKWLWMVQSPTACKLAPARYSWQGSRWRDLSIHKILVPIVFADASAGYARHIAQQAAWLARRFHAKIILLNVVTPLSYPAGLLESGHEITARDLHAHIVQRAQKDLDQALRSELDGLRSPVCC